jgi:thioesterase domain-containing protein
MLDLAGSLGLSDLVCDLPTAPTLAEMVELGRRAGRLPVDFQTVHVERMAEVFRNTVRACPEYRPQSWAGPMLLLRATRRPHEAGPAPDWSCFVAGPLEVVDLDCTHLNLVAPEMAPSVAAIVARALASVVRPPLPLTYV